MLYISHILLEPDIASRWVDLLQKEIALLNFMPFRYPLADEEPWRSYGIRKMTVKNFLVYYIVDDKEKLVSVTAVVYGRRDQLTALRDMPINQEEK